MSTNHVSFDELAAAYAVGALDGAEVARFEQHVADGCPECRRAVDEYREALARVADGWREEPPAHVRARLLADIARPRPASRIRLVIGWGASMAVAAGLAAVVTGSWIGRRYEDRLAQMAHEATALREQLAGQLEAVAELRRQLDEQQHTLTLVRTESEEQRRRLTLLGDPGTRVVTLVGLKPSPDALGRIFWNPRAGGLLVAGDLPRAPEGKAYELWLIAAGTPRPAGVFTVDAEGRGSLTMPPIEGLTKVDVFAVTLEPAGGVPAPTGEMYLASRDT
jgi:anti-sigma-K factor RskA